MIACTFLGDWAVLAAGLVSALAVAAGVTLTARTAAGERRAEDRRERRGGRAEEAWGVRMAAALDNTGGMTVDALTDVAGLRVGHATRTGDGWLTGTTVVLAPEGGAVAAVDVRGGGPGTKETDALIRATSCAVSRRSC